MKFWRGQKRAAAQVPPAQPSTTTALELLNMTSPASRTRLMRELIDTGDDFDPADLHDLSNIVGRKADELDRLARAGSIARQG